MLCMRSAIFGLMVSCPVIRRELASGGLGSYQQEFRGGVKASIPTHLPLDPGTHGGPAFSELMKRLLNK